MFNGLKSRIIPLACFSVLFLPGIHSYAQNCDPGADGITPVGGGVTQLANGQVCANKMNMVDLATMNVLYTNVDDGGNPNAVEFFIDWNDGTTQTLFFSLGEITQPGFPANSYQATVTHLFPAAGGSVQCEYLPQVFLQFSGTPCPGSVASPPAYVRWNTDDQLTGNQVLAEENTGVVTFQVCAGDSFPVRFSDQSTFNCVPPAYNNLTNDRERWTQFIYGTTNTITSGTGVQVNGVFEVYPFTGVVTNDPTPSLAPFATTLNITVPADASVGEQFEITMNSWNFCNRFDMGEPPVVTTARILIIASPAAPTVPPTNFCVGADPTITVSGGGGIFTWYRSAALLNPADVVFVGATFDPTTDPPPADRLNNSVPGTKTYYVTETLGVNNCEGPATTVTFNIIANPTPSVAGVDFSICSATSQLSGNTPIVGTGLWTSAGPGNVVAGQQALPNANIENLVAGTTTTFTWTITNGVICVDASSVNVTRDLLPSPAMAGPDVSLCVGTSVMMNAVPPAVGIGAWTITGGTPGSIAPVDLNNPNATVTGLIPGTITTLDWEVTNLTCAPPAIAPNIDAVQILNFIDPPADAGPDVFVCAPATTAILNAVDPSLSSPTAFGTWSTFAGPGNVVVGQLNLPNAAVQNLVLGTPTTFRWTVENGPGPVCLDFDDVVVTIEANPTLATATTPSPNICTTTSTVTGNVPVAGTGAWTWSGGTGNVVAGEEMLATANVENISPATTTTFTWTVSTVSCGFSAASVNITNDSPTTSIAGPNQNICASTTVLAANPVGGGETGTWTWLGGTGNVVAGEENLPNANVQNMTQGTTTTFTWTIDNGICPVSASNVNITFDPVPTPSVAGPNQTICAAITVLSGNVPGGGETGTWTWLGGTGNVVAGEENMPNANVENMSQGTSTTFTWTISNTGCPGTPSSLTITRVNDLTVPAAGGNQTICAATSVLIGNPVGAGETGTWTWSGGTGNVVAGEENLPIANVENLSQSTTTTFTWTISNGVCTDLFSSMQVTRVTNVTTPNAGPDQNICVSISSLSANAVGAGETGTWTWIGGTGNVVAGEENLPGANVQNMTQGTTTTFTWTISNGTCTPLSSNVMVTFDEFPTTAAAGPDQVVCVASTTLQGNDVSLGIGAGLWSFAPTNGGIGGAIVTPTLFNSVFTGTAGETYELRWTISNGSCSDSFDEVTIDFSSALPVSSISGDPQACIGDFKTYIIPGGNSTLYNYTWNLAGLPPSTNVVAGSGDPFHFITLEFNDATVGGILGVVVDDGTCFGPLETFSITVLEPPSMLLVSSDADGIICENESVTFTASDALGIADNFEFQVNGNIVQSGPTPTYTTTSLTSVDQVVVIGTAGGICPKSSTPPILHTVNPAPVSFNIQGGGTYCTGGSGVQIGLDGSEPSTTYELYLDGSPTGITQTPGGGAFNFPPQTLAGDYTIFAVSSLSCGEFMTGSTSIALDPLPSVFNITGGGSFCSGTGGINVGLDDSEIGVNYQLYRDGNLVGFTLPGTSASLDFGVFTTDGDYEIVATNPSTFCAQTMAGTSIVKAIPRVAPSFTLTSNPVEVTNTPHVTITNTTSNKSAWTYTWDWGDGTTSSDIDPGSHTYVNDFGQPTYGTFQITQTVFYGDANVSCEADSSVIFNVVPVLPSVDFEADVLEGCRPLTVNFNNSSVSIDQETVFWEFFNSSGVLVGTSNLYHASFTFYDAGKFTVRLTAGNSIGTAESETKELYITVNELPVAGFILRPDFIYLPDGIMYPQNETSNGADEFFWVFNLTDYLSNDGSEKDLTSIMFEPEVIYNRKGFKDVMLIATISATGCADTSIVEKAVFVDDGGLTRVPNAFTPSIYGPSTGGGDGTPGSSGSFNEMFLPVVQGLSSEPGSFHMLIFDRWGNLLFESWNENQGWDGYDKNARLLPLGVYVYKLDLRFEDGTSAIRLGDVTLIR